MKHFIIYKRLTKSIAYFACAETAQLAFRNYALRTFAKETPSGLLQLKGQRKKPLVFSHEIEAIECCEKAACSEWSMQRVRESDWNSDGEESFSGYDPDNIKRYTSLCCKQHPGKIRRGLKAFGWYFHRQPLITFYKPRKRGMILPSDIKCRFLIVGNVNAVEWNGNYEIMAEGLDRHIWEEPISLRIPVKPITYSD